VNFRLNTISNLPIFADVPFQPMQYELIQLPNH